MLSEEFKEYRERLWSFWRQQSEEDDYREYCWYPYTVHRLAPSPEELHGENWEVREAEVTEP